MKKKKIKRSILLESMLPIHPNLFEQHPEKKKKKTKKGFLKVEFHKNRKKK